MTKASATKKINSAKRMNTADKYAKILLEILQDEWYDKVNEGVCPFHIDYSGVNMSAGHDTITIFDNNLIVETKTFEKGISF